ncbi:MAG: hypothetical protein IT348_03140 [Candidatus Eisenbacteria bacterium]|nr:hypothetical protein [Candidatus Eisenbacteria bacterium]
MLRPAQARLLHTIAAVLFVLTGIAHAIGQYAPSAADPATDAIVRQLKTARLAGASFTWWQVLMCWGALYGAMSFLFGVHALAVTRSCAHDPRVVRSSARVLAVAAIAQSVVALFYTTAPPAFFMIPAAVLCLIAGWAPARDAD